MNFFILSILIILFPFEMSSAVIHQMTDIEHEQLPPLFEMEKYETCMEAPEGNYCVASLELYAETNNTMYQIIQDYSKHTAKHFNYTRIDRGICVTKTCYKYAKSAGIDIKRDLRAVLEGCLNETMINQYSLKARIINMNCEKHTDDDNRYIDYIDYIALSIFIILLVLIMVGSCYENYLGKNFLLGFSIINNLKNLTAVDNHSDRRLNIFKSLHGIRSIATYIVILAHSISTGFISDPHNFEKSYESTIQLVIITAMPLIVQVFLIISGLLLTYFLEISSEKNNITWKDIPMIVFQRWWRLTPPAALMVGFTATWMRHLGHGPLWNTYITNGPSGQCRKYFWAHMLYFNNYMPDDKLCAQHTWYIAADMQLTIIGLIVHFVIRNRSSNFKIVTLFLVLAMGMASHAVHVWLQDLQGMLMYSPEFLRSLMDSTVIDQTTFRTTHLLGHNNVPCYVIGMATGYWLYYLQREKIDISKSKIINSLNWIVLPTFVLTIYCGTLFYCDAGPASLIVRMIFATVIKPFFGLLFAVWLVGIMSGFNGLSKLVTEWPGWVVPSRLSYMVYLLHPLFFFVSFGLRTHLTPVSYFNVLFTSIGVMMVTYAVALPCYLLVEAPVARILQSNRTNKKKSS